MNLSGKQVEFRPTKRRSNPYRIMIMVVIIVACFTLIRGFESGTVKPLFLATPTPTRTTNSFAQEGETHFAAGNLEKAILSYKDATRLDANDPLLWAELARIETYSSNLLTTNEEQRARLKDALDAINNAKALAPDDSSVRAIRAFVLDWNSNPLINPDQTEALLTEAEQEAVAALQLDSTNTLALAFYAEILVDQQKWPRAEQFIQQAMQRDASLMDVHRIQGYVHETLGKYNLAIQEYTKASEIMPNLTFLYIQIGKIYRYLEHFQQALDLFEKAARLNTQLGINDPIPYLAIANTYANMGEFFSAARNVKKALSLNPTSPDVYGQLGIIYHKSRNYEGAVPALECAIHGCSPEQSCEVRQEVSVCDFTNEPSLTITGMPLSSSTVMYYYTYGSVQSGLHRPGDDRCVSAMEVFAQVKAKFASDSTIMSIVKEGEDICTSP